MSNYVLRRPDFFKVGSYGDAEAACTDIGSIRKVTFTTAVEMATATSSKYNDAVVEVAYSGHSGTLTVEFEEITAYNAALALLATSSGTTVYSDADDSTPAYKAVYCGYFPIGGADKVLHLYRAVVKPGTEMALANEQQVPTLEFTAMVDPNGSTGEKFWQMAAASADTTAPTITTWNPSGGETGVSASATYVWTFSEAIRTEDINSDNFFFTASGGAVKAGALVWNASANTVTFTPTTAWVTATPYTSNVSPNVRDTAGNELGAWNSKTFTIA